MRKLNLANCLTGSRILGAAVLLFVEPLSTPFYIVYTLCGLSDTLDGTVARRSHTASSFGAKLDSAADLVFYAVMLLRLFPTLWGMLPRGIWLWVAGILALRVTDYTVTALKFRKFASLHSILNKLTSVLIFAVPFLLEAPYFEGYCVLLCTVATAGTLHGLIIHIVTKAD